MKRILGIDTSTESASLALFEDDNMVYQQEYRSDRSHNSELFAPIGLVFDQFDEPDLIVIGIGPGSYTGIRIGIAATLALSMARNLPLAALPSVHAQAEDGQIFAVVGDARRGQFFHGVVDPSQPKFAPQVVPDANGMAGPLGIYAENSLRIIPLDPLSKEQLSLTEAIPADPTAAGLVHAYRRIDAKYHVEMANCDPLPIYLQAPFTTTPKQKEPPSR